MRAGMTSRRRSVPWYWWPLAPFVLLAAIPLILPLVLLALVSIPLHLRFHLGSIPVSSDFVPDASWRRLREPSPWGEKLIALPVGLVAAGTVAALWYFVTPLQTATLAVSVPAVLLAFAGIVVVHELLHVLAHPMRGRSPHSVIGFSPSEAFFYGHYAGEVSRNRFLTILLMPLIIISVVPLLVSATAQVGPGWVAVVSVFNVLLAFSDLLLVSLVLFQIPKAATVRQQGWKTYWRLNPR